MLTKVSLVKAIAFSVVIYGCELKHKENWEPRNWYFQTVVLENTIESHLDGKDIKPVNPKGSQSWIFIGRTDAEADAKNCLIEKDPDAGKDWRQEEKGMTEDEIRLGGITDSMDVNWASSGRWWRKGKPGVLQSMGSQRVGHNWVTELNWTECCLRDCDPNPASRWALTSLKQSWLYNVSYLNWLSNLD